MKNTYALIIGIENYIEGGLKNVQHAENDANGFHKALLKNQVPEENTMICVNSNATLGNIKFHLKTLVNNLTAEDRFIFFYAGHGVKVEKGNYLTTYECRVGFTLEVSIELIEIIELIEQSECVNTILFLDACHSELSADTSIRSPLEKLSPEMLKKELSNTKHLACFSSCSANEKSYGSAQYPNGIWTHYLIQAISGKQPSLITSGSLLSSNLQDYLSINVPKQVKLERGIQDKQTPRLGGSMTGSFEVISIPVVEETKTSVDYELELYGETRDSVSCLSGWESNYFITSDHAFLINIAINELELYREVAYKALKTALDLKSSEITCDEGDAGFGIVTPHCLFAFWIEYAEDEPSEYVIKFTLEDIDSVETLDKLQNSKISEYFDRGRCISNTINISKSIYNLENNDFDVETNSSLTWFSVDYETPDATVEADTEYMTVDPHEAETMNQIFEQTDEVLDDIHQYLIIKILPKFQPPRFRS